MTVPAELENSRGKAAVTIGLQTITANKNATIIIMAAGEGKAAVVRAALEEKVRRWLLITSIYFSV
jgi:6-phosphogluconolactonase/glucosamine-6-phosphate isomerase/deaminase